MTVCFEALVTIIKKTQEISSYTGNPQLTQENFPKHFYQEIPISESLLNSGKFNPSKPWELNLKINEEISANPFKSPQHLTNL